MALGAELLDSSLEVGSWDEVENLAEQGAESLHVESPLWQAAEVWLPPSLLGEAQRLPALDQHANLDKSGDRLIFCAVNGSILSRRRSAENKSVPFSVGTETVTPAPSSVTAPSGVTR